MKYTVILVNYNSDDLINMQIKSLENYATEIIVVDNSSNVDIRVKPRFSKISILAGHGNIGYGQGNNLGVRAASNEMILILNPDAAVDVETIPKIKDIDVDNCIVGAFDTKKAGFCDLISVDGFFKYKRVFYKKSYAIGEVAVNYVSGCFMLISKNNFERIGGFDENIFLYGEDWDLCLRAQHLGIQSVINTDLKISHLGGKSSDGFLYKIMRIIRSVKGHKYVLAKNFSLSRFRLFLNAVYLASGK